MSVEAMGKSESTAVCEFMSVSVFADACITAYDPPVNMEITEVTIDEVSDVSKYGEA